MKVIPSALPGVLVVEPEVRRDARGFFLETYHLGKFREAGLEAVFVQDNHASSAAGVLRGLHAQLMRPQGKLVRVIEGAVFDVAVDIRRGSPGFGRWAGVELSAENFRQVYVPPGFAHGYWVLTERAQFEYKVTDFYEPAGEVTVRWDDPAIGIRWPGTAPVLSEKDKKGRTLSELGDLLPLYKG